MLAIPLAGLALVLFGAFSRTYTIESLGSCFFVDVISAGPFCFEVGSKAPEIIVYGANMLGLALCIYGIWLGRQAKLAKEAQQRSTDSAA
jgi:arginine exporter protein ArgO